MHWVFAGYASISSYLRDVYRLFCRFCVISVAVEQIIPMLLGRANSRIQYLMEKAFIDGTCKQIRLLGTVHLRIFLYL